MTIDWLTLVKQGLIDEVIVQIYRPTTEQVVNSLTNSGLNTAKQYLPVGVGVYTGDFFKLKSLSELQSQISVVEKSNYGYVLFSWEYLFTPLNRKSKTEKEKIFFNR